MSISKTRQNLVDVARQLFAKNGKTVIQEYRGVEQLVARQAHNLEVARSSPASATKETRKFNRK